MNKAFCPNCGEEMFANLAIIGHLSKQCLEWGEQLSQRLSKADSQTEPVKNATESPSENAQPKEGDNLNSGGTNG